MRMSQSAPSYLQVMLLWVLAAVLVPEVASSFVSDPVGGAFEQLSELVAGGIDLDLALRALELSSGQMFAVSALNIVLWVYQLVMSFGLVLYCLRLYRGDPCGPSELFAGFTMAGRVVGAQVLVTLICIGIAFALAIALALLVVFVITTLPEAFATILCIALYIAFIVLLLIILLSYALTTYALADQPELGAMGAIQYAKNLMRGHKGQYFVLVLSFFGWMVLCELLSIIFTSVFTAGSLYAFLPFSLPFTLPAWASSLISTVLMLPYYLWLTPYMTTTIAGFYEALYSDGFKPELPPL